MVLRYDRRSTPGPRLGTSGDTGRLAATDVGRSLWRERTRQGLSLLDVRDRTGIPVDQLRAAETGALDRPDGLATPSTFRRYAAFLGLPGDRYAFANDTGARTAAVDGPLPASPPDAHEPTGQLAARRAPAPADNFHAAHEPYRYDDSATSYRYDDTGIAPAVPSGTGRGRRGRQRGGAVLLKALVALVALAVVAGTALLAVDRLHPAWLREISLVRSPAGTVSSPKTAPEPSATSHGAAPAAVALHAHRTSAGSATVDVPASTFTVEVSAVRGPCWVEVTSSTSPSPLYAGSVVPGSPQRFAGATSLAIDLGSTAGHVSISAPGVRTTAIEPAAIPYALTVTSRS